MFSLFFSLFLRVFLQDIKKLYPFGQVPSLEVDGKVLVQSMAIARYLACEFGLAGKDNWEKARCDMIVDAIRDPMLKLVPIMFEPDEAVKAEKMKNFVANEIPPFLKVLERLLSENNGGTGYIVGDTVTWADLCIMGMIETFQKLSPACVDDFPLLNSLHERVRDLPNIKAHYANRPSCPY